MDLPAPLVILIGGVTGIGKSTVACRLAERLRGTTVISTDVVREVLRTVVPREEHPALHVSSFDADQVSSGSQMPNFHHQARLVCDGIQALIGRAIREGTNIVVEGVHILPSLLDGWEQQFHDAILVPAVLSLSDAAQHRRNFRQRAVETRSQRPCERYLAAFSAIRRIQAHLRHQALAAGVPVVEARHPALTVQDICDLVLAKASGPGQSSSGAAC